jgi:hypothetical protein
VAVHVRGAVAGHISAIMWNGVIRPARAHARLEAHRSRYGKAGSNRTDDEGDAGGAYHMSLSRTAHAATLSAVQLTSKPRTSRNPLRCSFARQAAGESLSDD